MINLVDLPDVVLEHIFSFLPFDAIAQNRIVCKRFNVVGGRVLNKGFYAVEKFNSKAVREIKAKLPRRESERRNHPWERQCSVLISVETRINMLGMTYAKWINNESCCFIPGKVIDEIYRVVRSVIKKTETTSEPVGETSVVRRALEILQELRDISSMAIEHFDDKILPQLKRNYYRSSVESMVDVDGVSSSQRGLVDVLDGLMKHRHLMMPAIAERTAMGCMNKVSSYSASSALVQAPGTVAPPHYLRLLIRESVNRCRLQTQAVQISTQSKEISDLRKQVDEWEEKFKELSAIVLKQGVPSTTTTCQSATDGGETSGSRIKDDVSAEPLATECERLLLKRKKEECEDGRQSDSCKIQKILDTSSPQSND